MKKIFGLGRGLESLIPSKNVPVTQKGDNVYNVEIHKIRPNPNQPRQDFDKESLKELAASIKKYGILQPLLVAKIEKETERGLNVEYELIAGERRWRAAQMANLPHVPVIVKNDFDESRVKLEVALVENLQRADLNALEEAEAYARLASEFKMHQKEIAQKVGKSREFVANTVRLLRLPAEMKEALRAGKISRTHARSLLAFKNPAQQKEAFKGLLAGTTVIRELEEKARSIHGPQKPRTILGYNPRFQELEQNLAKTLDTHVSIKNVNSGGGNILIRFTDLEELNKIVRSILD